MICTLVGTINQLKKNAKSLSWLTLQLHEGEFITSLLGYNPRINITKMPTSNNHLVEGYEEYKKFVEEFDTQGKSLYILFSGSKLPNGQSWCPDCVGGNKKILKLNKIKFLMQLFELKMFSMLFHSGSTCKELGE